MLFPSQPFHVLADSSHVPVCSLKVIGFPTWRGEGKSYLAKLFHNTQGDLESQKRGEVKRSLEIKLSSWSKEEEKVMRQMKMWQGGLICIYLQRFNKNIIIAQLYSISLFPLCI